MEKSSSLNSPLASLLACWMKPRRRRYLKYLALFLSISSMYLCLVVFVPDAWKEADLVHVVRVIADVQDFDLKELNDIREKQKILGKFFQVRPEYRVHGGSAGHQSYINIQTFLSRLAKRPRKEFYPEYFQEVEALKSLSFRDPAVRKNTEMLLTFQPILTQQEKAGLLLAFDVFSHVCQEAGVTYFLLEASLMGVRRHHGMIPWDDDIDIVVNASQWRTLHALLSSLPGFELYAPRMSQWKFYPNTSMSFPDKPFKFPYLDIFFFNEDADFVWAVTQGLKHDLVHKKPDIFPLRLGLFEDRWVPVPNNLPLLVDASHDVSECITGEYNHKTNQKYYYGGKVRVPCTSLTKVYPFVLRETNKDGSVTETLRVGPKVLNTHVVKS